MSWRLERPDIDPGSDSFEFSRDAELCTVGGHRFILANIELPYHGDGKFVWTCWISQSDASFQRIDQRWDEPGRENDEPTFGWLSSALPTYEPSTMGLKTRVHQRPVCERPWVELEPTDHPLSIEQREGIDDTRIAAVWHTFSPSRRELKKLYGNFYGWLVAKFDEWDPLGLVIEPGQEEYALEVGHIMPLLRTPHSVDELAADVHAIFVQTFFADIAGPVETYKPFAREIIEEWQKQRGTIRRA